MFERCCSSRSTINYEIVHNPQPIALSNDMDEVIKNLLWYAPNIDSYQAIKSELISEKVYDDFSFIYILNKMGMVENRDVKWIEPNASFDEADWTFFEDSICTCCQKIIKATRYPIAFRRWEQACEVRGASPVPQAAKQPAFNEQIAKQFASIDLQDRRIFLKQMIF